MPTIAVHAKIVATMPARPPLVLIHGAANSAIVWTYWQDRFAEAGWTSFAVDLRGHGQSESTDLSDALMADYLDDAAAVVQQLDRKPIVIGWSMGGLVALMTAARGLTSGCVGLAPSRPERSQNETVELRTGTMDATTYGITSRDPSDQPAMPDLDLEERTIALDSLGLESLKARDDRQRGVVIASLPCPLLVVTGALDSQWPASRYEDLWLPADRLEVPECSHWGLVLNRRAITWLQPPLIEWLSAIENGGG